MSAMLEQLYSKKCNGYIRLDDDSCTLLSNRAKKFVIELQEKFHQVVSRISYRTKEEHKNHKVSTISVSRLCKNENN